MANTHVRLEWSDSYVPEFRATDEAVGGNVFGSFTEAKNAALASARDEREQWAATVRALRTTTASAVIGLEH